MLLWTLQTQGSYRGSLALTSTQGLPPRFGRREKTCPLSQANQTS